MIRRIVSRSVSSLPSPANSTSSKRTFVRLSYPPIPRVDPTGQHNVPTAIFIDHTGLPTDYDPYAVVKTLRRIALNDGGSLRQFAYLTNDDNMHTKLMRSMGVLAVPFNSGKNDRQCALQMSNMMWSFLSDNEANARQVRIICLTSDVDVMYAGSLLVNRGVKLTTIAPSAALFTSFKNKKTPSPLATATDYYLREDLPLTPSALTFSSTGPIPGSNPYHQVSEPLRLEQSPPSPPPEARLTRSTTILQAPTLPIPQTLVALPAKAKPSPPSPQVSLPSSPPIAPAPSPKPSSIAASKGSLPAGQNIISDPYSLLESSSQPTLAFRPPETKKPPLSQPIANIAPLPSIPGFSTQANNPSSPSSTTPKNDPFTALYAITAAQQSTAKKSKPSSNMPARPITFISKGEPFEPIKKIVRVLPVFYPISPATRPGLTHLFTSFLLDDIKAITASPLETIADAELVEAYLDFVQSKVGSWSSTKYQKLPAPAGSSRLSTLTTAAPTAVLAEVGSHRPKLQAFLNVLAGLVKLSGGARDAFEMRQIEKILASQPEAVLQGSFSKVRSQAEEKKWTYNAGKWVVAKRALTGFGSKQTRLPEEISALYEKPSTPVDVVEPAKEAPLILNTRPTFPETPFTAPEREIELPPSPVEVVEAPPPPAELGYKIVDGQMVWD